MCERIVVWVCRARMASLPGVVGKSCPTWPTCCDLLGMHRVEVEFLRRPATAHCQARRIMSSCDCCVDASSTRAYAMQSSEVADSDFGVVCSRSRVGVRRLSCCQRAVLSQVLAQLDVPHVAINGINASALPTDSKKFDYARRATESLTVSAALALQALQLSQLHLRSCARTLSVGIDGDDSSTSRRCVQHPGERYAAKRQWCVGKVWGYEVCGRLSSAFRRSCF